MAFITADRVLDSSTSTGTGAFVVSGTPAAGYRTFSAVMSVGDTCYYSIQGQTTSEWEVGLGTYSSANTLARTTIYSSSNAGSAVTFSAGTKNVFITIVASKAPQLDPSGNVTALGTPASATLTNATGLSLTTGVTGVLPSAYGGSLAWQSVQTGNFTAVAGRAYWVNTTAGAITVTLPASPTLGQIVQLTDYAGTWGTNNVTVAPNGAKITGLTTNSVLSISGSSIGFVYSDSTQGWIPYSAFKTLSSGQPYSASYLIVAGGGGGGVNGSGAYGDGGGGAGGLLSGTTTFAPGTTYSTVVGAGGAGSATINANGTQGSSSSLTGITTAVGGGYGAGANSATGGSGGSGGGGNTGGSATSGQGFAGGSHPNGGGGGAAAAGQSINNGTGGVGAITTLITTTQATSASVGQVVSSSVYFAGGGGGGISGLGGSGGGGAASNSVATSGTANTGGGGGASNLGPSGAGGSGAVLISVPTANYTATTTGSPVVFTNGSNTVMIFKASGSYTA